MVKAQDYGQFLREAGIKEMPIWLIDQDYVDEQNKPFERQNWFGRLDFVSLLNGNDWGLFSNIWLRGVCMQAT